MPLSPQDQAYWKEKLGWKSFLYITAATVGMGCVVWPLVQFILSATSGHASDWTWSLMAQVVVANFFLALLVSTLIWCIGQMYYYMDWLPPRR